MPHFLLSLVAYLCCPFSCTSLCSSFSFFFFTDTATTEIYTLSLHDALPISRAGARAPRRTTPRPCLQMAAGCHLQAWTRDRKSTRLNSSHLGISYAVFCLKKKKKKKNTTS